MARRDIGTDDPRVRVRPGKGSRPRTKIRPDYSSARRGRVFRVDRGRYHVKMLDDDVVVTTIKARELPRGSIVVGDVVAVVGDLSGRKDTLARIAAVDERRTALRRTAEESESAGVERVIVANADQMVIVTALAQPEPRLGMIDRALVAAYDAGMHPILLLTKADLADADELKAMYRPLELDIYTTSVTDESEAGVEELKRALSDHVSVLVGHSGVGKSTLINALVPSAQRLTGEVNEVTGRGRHTSTSAMAFPLADGGTVIDTPGIRTFGLAHVQVEDLLRGFPDLAEIAQDCPRGCEHDEDSPGCALDTVDDARTQARVVSFRRLLRSRQKVDEG